MGVSAQFPYFCSGIPIHLEKNLIPPPIKNFFKKIYNYLSPKNTYILYPPPHHHTSHIDISHD